MNKKMKFIKTKRITFFYIFFIMITISFSIKVDGFSEYNGIAGKSLLLPCNKSAQANWTNFITMVFFYKGVNGKPLFTMNRRDKPHNKSIKMFLNKLSSNSNSFYYDNLLGTPVYSIEYLQEKDKGEYRCRIDYKQSRTRNYVIKLNVIVSPKENIIMDLNGNILDNFTNPIEENENLSLVCEAFGKPAPSVTWWMNKRLIDDSYFKRQISLSRNELLVNQLNKSYLNEKLTCKSQNSNLTQPTIKTIIIDLILKPLEAKIIIDRKRLEAGIETLFKCIVYGSRPSPFITWHLIKYYDKLINESNSSSFLIDQNENLFDQLLKNSQNETKLSLFQFAAKTALNQVVNENENIYSSQIRFRLSPTDNGQTLICKAKNFRLSNKNSTQASLLLNVFYKPIVKLKLGTSINPDRIKEGSDLYLDCDINSNPTVTSFRFLKQGQPISYELGVLIANQTLVLQQVKRKFRALYTCEATNSLGISFSNEVYLRIQYLPVCSIKIPQIKSINRNGIIQLLCHVHSDPGINSFKWYLNNSSETIKLDKNSSIFNFTYLPPINSLENYSFYYDKNSINKESKHIHTFEEPTYISIGNFMPNFKFDFATIFCVAENSIGLQQDPCIFHIIPADPPLRPKNCVISNHSLTSINVHCFSYSQKSLSSKIKLKDHNLNNKIYYMLLVYEKDSNLILNLTHQDAFFQLNSLRPSTQYTLLLYAINDQGKSPVYKLNTATLGLPEKRQIFLQENFYFAHHFSYLIILLLCIILIIMLIVLLLRLNLLRCFKIQTKPFITFKLQPDVVPNDIIKANVKHLENLNNTDSHLLKSFSESNELNKYEKINSSNQEDLLSFHYKMLPWKIEKSFKKINNFENAIYQPSINVITCDFDSKSLKSTCSSNDNQQSFSRIIPEQQLQQSAMYNLYEPFQVQMYTNNFLTSNTTSLPLKSIYQQSLTAMVDYDNFDPSINIYHSQKQ